MRTTPLSIELPDLDSAPEPPTATSGPKREGSIIGGLFREQADRMRHFLTWRMRNEEDAKDATQEVFLKMWCYERAGQLRAEARSYLYSASHTVAIDEERRDSRHQRDRVSELDLDTLPGSASPAEDRVYWRKAVAHLVNGMEALPVLTREVFMLHHFEGLRYPEIAERLGVSQRTVERHIALGTSELRARMKEYL